MLPTKSHDNNSFMSISASCVTLAISVNASLLYLTMTSFVVPSSSTIEYCAPLLNKCKIRSFDRSKSSPPGLPSIISSICVLSKQTSSPYDRPDLVLSFDDPLHSNVSTDSRGKLLHALIHTPQFDIPLAIV